MRHLAILFAAAAATSAAAAETRWQTIASREVALTPVSDVIAIDGAGSHSLMRLCAAGSTVRIIDVGVRFASGERLMVPARARLDPGRCTADIALLRGERVTQLRLNYERMRRRSPAMLHVQVR
ncbi:MAG: hypothetical protein ACT4OE_03645 [Sphingosinicella sp.]